MGKGHWRIQRHPDILPALKGKDAPSVTAEDDRLCDHTYRFRFPFPRRGISLPSLRLITEDGCALPYRASVVIKPSYGA